MVKVFFDVIIMWLSCVPEITHFTSEVCFIELAEGFQMKIMCIYGYISAPPPKKKQLTFFAVCCISCKKTMVVCFLNKLLIYKYQQIFPTKECYRRKYDHVLSQEKMWLGELTIPT